MTDQYPSKNKHILSFERDIIKTGITNGSTKSAIAATIGKDKSTVAKEIKKHRTKKSGRYPTDCASFRNCKDRLSCAGTLCENYKQFSCKRRDRSPGACNGCENFSRCHYDKYIYNADQAQKEYESDLKGMREGINLTYNEAKALADIIVPLVKRGLSPYAIIQTHKNLGICEKTLYNYIEDGVFREFGLSDVDLRIKVRRRKPTRNKGTKFKKRIDRSYLTGRKESDYQDYMSISATDGRNVHVVQMDTVYNGNEAPYIQTFKFLFYGFFFALYHEDKTADDMTRGINTLEEILSSALFRREAEVIKTDRGTEFTDAEGIETDSSGNRRTHLFYCDPMCSHQKGSLENKHREFRYIIPKGVSMKELGLRSQTDLNKVISHINSVPLQSLNGRTPFEVLRFYSQELYDRFISFGLEEIEKDKVILKPYLLK